MEFAAATKLLYKVRSASRSTAASHRLFLPPMLYNVSLAIRQASRSQIRQIANPTWHAGPVGSVVQALELGFCLSLAHKQSGGASERAECQVWLLVALHVLNQGLGVC
jgi:hypothetical protein